MIQRARDNSVRVLKAARAAKLPVASCFIEYKSEREMPRWKVGLAAEQFRLGGPGAKLDSRVFDPDYDLEICKPAPSIFFQTVAQSFFTREGVDTVVVLGAATSGCIRASVIDSFSLGYLPHEVPYLLLDGGQFKTHDNLMDGLCILAADPACRRCSALG